MRKLIEQRPFAVFAFLLLGLTLLFMEAALFPAAGQAVGSHDMRGLFVPWLAVAREAVWHGHLPWWDASLFAGYPFLSNPQVALFYPPTWLAIILPVNVGISWYLVLHIWLVGLGMYWLVRRLGGTQLGAMLGGLAFAFSGYMAARIYAGHIGLLATNSWLPWLLLATVWSVRRKTWWSAVLLGVPFALSILAGHTTSLIYVGLLWGIFALYLALDRTFWQRMPVHLQAGAKGVPPLPQRVGLVLRQLLIAGLVGLALSAVQLVPLLQFMATSTRTAAATYEFATAYSFPPAHLITFLVPEFFGEPTRVGTWSVPNFEELTYYVGILPLWALVVALKRPSRQIYFWLGIMGLGLLLALGGYGFFYQIVYDLVPIFRLTRAPARAAYMTVLAASVILGLALNRSEEAEEVAEGLRWLMPVTAVLIVAAMAATGAAFAAQHPTDTSGRLWHQTGGWAIVLVWVLVTGGVLRQWFKTGQTAWAVVLGLVLLSDLWLFGFKLVRLEETAVSPFWTETKAVIGDEMTRVLPWGVSIFEQNGAEQVGLMSVFGYNALEVGANIDFVSSVPDPRSSAYDVMGAGYVVAPVPQEQFMAGEQGLQFVEQTGSAWIYRRPQALPLARLVTQVEIIPDTPQAVARVHQPDFDAATTVILAEAPPCELTADASAGLATIETMTDGFWRIMVRTETPALLVLSETDYPGWRVTVDGQPAQNITAYTAVRAVCVPAGEHAVEWTFVPTVYWLGGLFSLLGLIVVGTAVWRRDR
ncbi:MAG: hypothetical protein CSB13_03640 [Chloroflexi bacterium]|nr:MAG: hypothetical protein CSB13_03640 [Chloroflexota bacterium]